MGVGHPTLLFRLEARGLASGLVCGMTEVPVPQLSKTAGLGISPVLKMSTSLRCSTQHAD